MPKTLKRKIEHRKRGTENIVVQATYQVLWIYNAHENNNASASCFTLYNTKITKQSALQTDQTEHDYQKSMLFLMRTKI